MADQAPDAVVGVLFRQEYRIESIERTPDGNWHAKFKGQSGWRFGEMTEITREMWGRGMRWQQQRYELPQLAGIYHRDPSDRGRRLAYFWLPMSRANQKIINIVNARISEITAREHYIQAAA